MKTQSWIIIAVILMQTCSGGAAILNSSKEEDKITSLPGQPQVSFNQYGGYVTVDENQNRSLFYYFVEAQTLPSSKPLVLWLSGGPGCSSVGSGAFSQHGPFRPSGGGNLTMHQYSWNKEANMLYLESPAGVGFSYSANTSFYDLVNDTITAQDNLIFLQQWLLKFPEYKNRDFFITGESYAGHHVPQLAKLIVESRLPFNLKGIAIGNPLLEFNTDTNSEGEYFWSHGLISDYCYELVNSVCNISQLWRELYINGSISSDGCKTVKAQLSAEIPNEINQFDVTADVCVSNITITETHNRPLRPSFRSSAQSQSEAADENIDVCVEKKTYNYLNSKDVQTVLHARLVGIGSWSLCSSVINYDRRNLEIPTIDVVGSLVSSGIRVLVYSGDQDSRIPFTSSRTLVNGLAKNLNLNASSTYRAWFEDQQVGGWTQAYGENILTHATIRGGSHMTPFSSPARSLVLFKSFLAGNSLPNN